jgi:penicillin amidase
MAPVVVSRVRLWWWALGSSVLIVGGAIGSVGVLAYRSIPEWSGRARVAGISQSLELVRDRDGVAHVFARSEADAYFGLGYAHAQDRLWQLELQRRLASGKLAEIFGADALDSDVLFRTLGLRRAAERSWPLLDEATRSALDAYVRGVNAFLQSGAPLPPEFALFRVQPRPWTAADSLSWLGMMAWKLSSNRDSELLRWRLSRQLSPQQIAEFLAPYPGDEPVVPSLLGLQGYPLPPKATGQRAPLGPITSGLGSNNWAVAGSRTESGKPLLANDPHLSLTAPSLWYLAHLQAPGLDVIGASLPGVPGVLLGRNREVAWAFTNTGSDTQDVFIERLVPGDAVRYEAPGGPREFERVHELIQVRGQPDHPLEVRISRHGPVISEAYRPATQLTGEGEVLALAWTALAPENRSIEFIIAASHARSADELRQAARRLGAPTQNVVYADRAGDIGFVAAGLVPRRRADNVLRGLLPAPGWEERFDWQGFVPFDELPQQRNPSSGRIVTANQKICPPDYPFWLGAEWAGPYRAQRIEALLDALPKHTLASFERIQLDVQSGSARALLPLLLAAISGEAEALEPRERALLDPLHTWDLQMRAAAVEPLLFSAWLRQVARAVYADELGELFEDVWAERVGFLVNVLSAKSGQERWCDDRRTPRVEACPAIVAQAFVSAVAELSRRYGSDPAEWRWGRAHVARARHAPLTHVPVLRDWFDLVSTTDGGSNTVNVGAYDIDDEDAPFESHHAAGYRAVYDLSDAGGGAFLVNGGQSGHVLSPHYRDWLEPFQRGALVPMRMDRAAVDDGALGTLRLEPARSEPAR